MKTVIDRFEVELHELDASGPHADAENPRWSARIASPECRAEGLSSTEACAKVYALALKLEAQAQQQSAQQGAVIVVRSDDVGKFRADNRERLATGQVRMIELGPRHFLDVTRLGLGPTDIVCARGRWSDHALRRLVDLLASVAPSWGKLVLSFEDENINLSSLTAEQLRLLYQRLGLMLRSQRADLESAVRAYLPLALRDEAEHCSEYTSEAQREARAARQQMATALEALSVPEPAHKAPRGPPMAGASARFKAGGSVLSAAALIAALGASRE